MVLLFILAILERLFQNAIFDIYLVVGILWFIVSGIIYARMQNEEKKAAFKMFKRIICIVFWVGLVAIGIIINIIAGPITLM